MALPVTSNISSLNAQRNLQKSTLAMGKSLERLSSGMRINHAGDDVAGLAISEGLRSQIRGMNQAVRNANDGLSLIGTAESAIGSYTEILQRLRELAVQSANDINSTNNRQAMHQEAQQLIAEAQRISTVVEFNGTKLLDGSFITKQLQVGAQANQTISISLGNLQASQVGQVAHTTGAAISAVNALATGDLLLNGVDVSPSLSDGISSHNASASAIAVANAINNRTAQHGVTAQALAAVHTGVGAIVPVTINPAAAQLQINGVNIVDSTLAISANDSTSTLRTAINAKTNQTGVTATVSGGQLVLTAADGRNISVVTSGGIGDELGLRATAGDYTNTAAPTGGRIKITSNEAIVVSGANTAYAGLTAGTIAKDANTALNTLSLTTTAGANTAISILDNALAQVGLIRGDMGAITNRLEHTIQNLQSISENFSASDSRIRDADFAVETANMTRNQILQQAGIAILSQANTSTQSALQLLKQ